jgi:hypothetical protein
MRRFLLLPTRGGRQVTDLSIDELSGCLLRLDTALDIANAALVCRTFGQAAKQAKQAFRLVCLKHAGAVTSVAGLRDGRIITASSGTLALWRDGVRVLSANAPPYDAPDAYNFKAIVVHGGDA